MTEPSITVQNLGGFGGATYSMIDNASGANWKFKATLTGGFKIRDHANGIDVFVIEQNTLPNLLYLKSGGNIGIGTATPASSALIDMSSTTKGFLPPRMTQEQIYAIPNPADGLLLYCTNCGSEGTGLLSMFFAGEWHSFSSNNCFSVPTAPTEGAHIVSENQIIWKWNVVTGATGYKWSIENDYTTAQDMGASITKIESGLIGSNSYMRFVWAYNACGNSLVTSLSSVTSPPFPCGDLVSYEGHQYNTVQIGDQCWFKDNLNIGVRIDVNQDQSNNSIIEKYCQNNLESNCNNYGGLYQWNESLNYLDQQGNQGICPAGWHIPTNDDWCTLTTYIDATVNCYTQGWNGTDGGRKMKSTSGWNINGNGTNESGFTAFPGGHSSGGAFLNLGNSAVFWSSSAYDSSNRWYWSLFYNQIQVGHDDMIITGGCSLRCIKD